MIQPDPEVSGLSVLTVLSELQLWFAGFLQSNSVYLTWHHEAAFTTTVLSTYWVFSLRSHLDVADSQSYTR